MSKSKKKKRLKRRRETREKVSSVRIIGTISVAPNGFGFVTSNRKDDPDVFIPERYVGSAMSGDKVEVNLLPPRKHDKNKDKGPAGKVTKILERAHSSVVGQLIAGKKIRPLSRSLPEEISLSGGTGDAKRGDWVEVELLHKKAVTSDEQKGVFTKTLGPVGELENDLQAIINEYDLPPLYTEEQDAEAATVPQMEVKREDYTDRYCITIDPEDAKDFDDAISSRICDDDKFIEIGVHIADVATWITPGSKWDDFAHDRAFTAYIPGNTRPMLPKTLTKKLSLTEGGVSSAHSVIFTINRKSGRVADVKRCHTRITVDKRLNYDQVQEFIDTKKGLEGWTPELEKNLNDVISVFRKMHSLRIKEERPLRFATEEIRVLCDDETKKVIGLKRKFQKESDQLIEEFMLAANSAVAVEIIEASIAGIFRIHPEPDPERLEEFSYFVQQTFGITTGDLTNRDNANNFIANLEDDHKKPLIVNAFLRSLTRASYEASPALHFGLGKEKYAHFTSPIRRYTDILVHRQLIAKDNNLRLMPQRKLEKLAQHCTDLEKRNDDAYFAANDRLKLHYLQKVLDEKGSSDFYEGMITKIRSNGFVIDIPSIGLFGFVPIEALDGAFRYNKEASKLQSKASAETYRCGDFIYVALDRIDLVRGSAYFKPVEK